MKGRSAGRLMSGCCYFARVAEDVSIDLLVRHSCWHLVLMLARMLADVSDQRGIILTADNRAARWARDFLRQ